MAYWLDDGFDTWPEVVRAGSAAAGLYVRCGSWIARNTQDGLVPTEVATMYGTPEWVAKLVAVGLWSTEQAGFRDVRYFEMGNPTAEKVRARRQADADRKARWRDKKQMSRRDTTRDSARSHTVQPRVNPLSPALPPSKEGQGTHAPAPLGAARASPTTTDTPYVDTDDPQELAEYRAGLAEEAEQRTRELAEADRRARNGAAQARAVLAGKTVRPDTRHPEDHP